MFIHHWSHKIINVQRYSAGLIYHSFILLIERTNYVQKQGFLICKRQTILVTRKKPVVCFESLQNCCNCLTNLFVVCVLNLLLIFVLKRLEGWGWKTFGDAFCAENEEICVKITFWYVRTKDTRFLSRSIRKQVMHYFAVGSSMIVQREFEPA